jgi:hypothetical protein
MNKFFEAPTFGRGASLNSSVLDCPGKTAVVEKNYNKLVEKSTHFFSAISDHISNVATQLLWT